MLHGDILPGTNSNFRYERALVATVDDTVGDSTEFGQWRRSQDFFWLVGRGVGGVGGGEERGSRVVIWYTNYNRQGYQWKRNYGGLHVITDDL